jgi:hypothetical protein
VIQQEEEEEEDASYHTQIYFAGNMQQQMTVSVL